LYIPIILENNINMHVTIGSIDVLCKLKVIGTDP